jgi:UDP-glucose 4-epimerase
VKKKILITGAAGFIGSNLANSLLKKKYQLILVDDLSNGKLINLDYSNRKKLIKKQIQKIRISFFKKIDCIIHLAASIDVNDTLKNYLITTNNNITSTLYIIKIAERCNCPIIFSSSAAVYKEKKNKKKIINPTSPYGLDKLVCENFIKLFNNLKNINYIIFRFFNIYGKNRNKYSSVINTFVENAKNGKNLIVNGGGQTRDFVYVDDLVKIYIKALNIIFSKKINKVFNISSNQNISIENLAKKIIKNFNSKSKIKFKDYIKGDVLRSSGSNKKILKYLKLRKNFFTKLDQGLKNV